MEIRHIVGGNPFENAEDFVEIFLNRTLSEKEMDVLKKCNITYEYLKNDILKLTIVDYGAYFVKTIEEKDRIYLEKTEWYYEYIREVNHIDDTEENKNLVISENGTRIEILI